MKRCELCRKAARMYCTSDQASLCWDCDSRVHAANFLVAKHTRTLLCHACQSPTSWTGSGAKLGPTVTVCEKCVDGEQVTKDEDGVDSEDEDEDDEDDDDDDDDENDDCDPGDDGENQVVPLFLPPSTSSTGQEASSSSSSRSDRFSGSSFGFVDNSRFSYNAIPTREEKSGREKKTWAWR